VEIRLVGEEIVASAGTAAGNGVSSNPVMDDQGHYVAFESTATNLCLNLCKGVSEDRNGRVTDIFRRTLSPKAPTKDVIQMVTFSFAVDQQANGPSANPAMSGAGENIFFESAATNLRQSPRIRNIDPNGRVRDIFYWNLPRRRGFGNISRESRPGRASEAGGYFSRASLNPGMSSRANYVGFTSRQRGKAGERNGPRIADIFIRYMGSFEGGVFE